MAEPARKRNTSLYEQDFVAWADDQGRLLRERRVDDLDWDNLAEEIESLSRREKAEIRSRLIVLLMHLLKWEFQPERRRHGWQTTIGVQRTHIEGVLEYSPSLRRFPSEIFDYCYKRARADAAQETRLPLNTFPEVPPFSVEQALDYAFMPGRPWSPDELS
jgi:hypothetical protein